MFYFDFFLQENNHNHTVNNVTSCQADGTNEPPMKSEQSKGRYINSTWSLLVYCSSCSFTYWHGWKAWSEEGFLIVYFIQ